MSRKIVPFLVGILVFLGLSGIGAAQTFNGDVTLTSPSPGTVTGSISGTATIGGTSYFLQGGAICSYTKSGLTCKPINQVPEINGDSGKLALAFVALVVLLSAERMRRRK
jgi:hypothetical protein